MQSRFRLAALVAAAIALAACGTSVEEAREAEALRCPPGSDCYDAPTPIGPGGSLSVRAPGFSFEILENNAVDGPVEVTFQNDDSTLHNFRIDEAAGETKKVESAGGATETGVLQLFAGSYTFYCDVPGHRAAGMEGTLTVAEADGSTAGPTEPAETAAGPGDPVETLDPNALDESSIEELDDSDDIAAALSSRGYARAYALTFASGSTELAPGANDVLEQISAILQSDPALGLRIEGNTDSTGNAADNQVLSEERAQAVVDALITRGADGSRLTAVGRGADNLLIEDDADDDLAKRINRRIEIHLVR